MISFPVSHSSDSIAASPQACLSRESEQERCHRLESVFNRHFSQTRRTLLEGGFSEPIYLPDEQGFARIRYRDDHFSSALHEIAHWTIAGKEREKQVDFGYWYEPDGRTNEQQSLFLRVEVKPQAVEWILSVVVGQKFHFSADNLAGESSVPELFQHNVLEQVRQYLTQGLPVKAEELIAVLQQDWKEFTLPTIDHFRLN